MLSTDCNMHGQLALRWKSLKKYKVSTSWLKNVSILKSPWGEKSIWSCFITETWCWNQGEIANNHCTVLGGNVIFFFPRRIIPLVLTLQRESNTFTKYHFVKIAPPKLCRIKINIFSHTSSTSSFLKQMWISSGRHSLFPATVWEEMS